MNMIQIMLIQIGVILALSRLLGMLMRQINQPQVASCWDLRCLGCSITAPG